MMKPMKNSAAVKKSNAKKPACDPECFEAPTPSDLHAMQQGDRDAAAGRLVSDADVTSRLAAIRRQRAGGAK